MTEQLTKELCGICGLPHYGLSGYNHEFIARTSNPRPYSAAELRHLANQVGEGCEECDDIRAAIAKAEGGV